MRLTTEQVDHIARLTRLELTAEERELFSHQLSDVLEYMERLREVDTESTIPTAQVTGLMDVLRADDVRACDEATRAKLIALFPAREDNLLKVPPVFDAPYEK